MSLGDFITAGGQAIQDLFGSHGATAQANSFTSAAQLAEQNADLSKASTRIQTVQQARQIFQAEGTQIADVAGAGFTESGSALDLLRSTAQQGALTQSLTAIQGAINENSYAAQAGAYRGAAAASQENAKANTVGAIASLGGALVNNGTALLSAGKTVVSGFNAVTDALFGSAPAAGIDFASGVNAASEVGSIANFLGPSGVSEGINFAGSAIDSAIMGGSDLSASLAASNIGLDTSGIALGTDVEAANTGLLSAFNDITDAVGSALSDVASSLGLDFLSDMSLSSILGPIGLVATIGSFIPGVGDVINTIENGVIDAVSSVGEFIGGIFGSVICTAYYKQGFISRRVWVADQRYGAQCDRMIFEGYYHWAKPVADQILKRRWVAHLFFPVFKPAIYEMAGQSTFLGRLSLKVFLAVSKKVGTNLKRRLAYAH